MGIEVSFLSLPEHCSLSEAVNNNDDVASWLLRIPGYLEYLEGGKLSKYNELSPRSNPKFKYGGAIFYSPDCAPFRQIWNEYIDLCQVIPGLETRYCPPSKSWLRLECLLSSIEFSDDDIDLSVIYGTELLSQEHSVSYNPPEIVSEVAVLLNHMTIGQIRYRYMADLNLWDLESICRRAWANNHVGVWKFLTRSDRELDDYIAHFNILQKFYNASAEHGESVFIARLG